MKQALTIFALLCLAVALSIAAVVAIERLGDAIDEEIESSREAEIRAFTHPADIEVSIDVSTLTPPLFTYYYSCGHLLVCVEEPGVR